MNLALALHILEHGTEGRFYSRISKYQHDGGKVYWAMDPAPDDSSHFDGPAGYILE